MIYSVSIFRPSGKLKKKISSKKLLKRHWIDFDDNEIKRKKNFSHGSIPKNTRKVLKEYRDLNNLVDEFAHGII